MAVTKVPMELAVISANGTTRLKLPYLPHKSRFGFVEKKITYWVRTLGTLWECIAILVAVTYLLKLRLTTQENFYTQPIQDLWAHQACGQRELRLGQVLQEIAVVEEISLDVLLV
jgi:hypothetical protein